MPFLDPSGAPALPPRRAPEGVTAPMLEPAPRFEDVLAAGFRQDNPLVNLFGRLQEEAFPPDPDHNPLDEIRGTDFEAHHLDRFVASRSLGETRAIMARISEEEEDRKTLAAASAAGFVAQIAAGMLDPTIALPGGLAVRSVKGGYAIGRSALVVGAGAAGQVGVQESVLRAAQETRTLGESAVAVSSAAILGGILGSGAAALLSRGERIALERLLDADRAALARHADQMQPSIPSAKPPLPGERIVAETAADGVTTYKVIIGEQEVASARLRRDNDSEMHVSRAEVDPAWQRQGVASRMYDRIESDLAERGVRLFPDESLSDEAYAFWKSRRPTSVEWHSKTDETPVWTAPPRHVTAQSVPLPAAAGAAAADVRKLELDVFGRAGAQLSVTRRVLASAAVEARRIMADLAEVPYRFLGTAAGEATTQGPALDRLARMEMNGARVEIGDELERQFADYRFGAPDTSFPRARARLQSITGRSEGKMGYADFKREVSVALQNGDQHALPQVAAAAQFIRRRLFEPWAARAEKAVEGFERLTPAEAEAYFPHIWNKTLIRARRPEFTNRLTDLYKADQDAKRAAQGRLAGLARDLEAAQERVAQAVKERDRPRSAAEKAREDETRHLSPVSPEGRRAQEFADATLAHDKVRVKIEEEIAAWEGKSVGEAKSAIMAREKYDTETKAEGGRRGVPDRLEAADRAIDRDVKRILASDRDISDAELRARASQTVDRILGSPDGRLPYDLHLGGPRIGFHEGPPPRASLAERQLNVSNAWARDWIEDDVEQVVAMHLRTVVPDVLIAERFGDVEMSQAFRRIEDNYAALIDATKGESERTKLGKQRDAVIRDVAAVRDRVRGVYGWSPDLANMARIANAAKSINNLIAMGVATISSLPDLAGTVFRYGLVNSIRDGWAPFFRGLSGGTEEWGKFRSQMRAIGIGVETAINARQHALDDVMDVYRPQSRLERTLQGASDKFFIANLLGPWTDTAKLVASHVAVSEILRATRAVAENRAVPRQLANLAESGIDRQMAGRIWAQFEKGGEVIEGVHLPNTRDWIDRAAADALNGAVARETDIMVVTPGQEKPLWMSKPVVSLLGQFKTFTAAATERLLIANLQRRDAAVLSGLLTLLSLGLLSYKLNSFFGGQKTSDRPQDWVKEAISRGGLLGWLEDGNAFASKATRGGVDIYRLIGADKPLSRFASRSAADMLLGPTWGKIESLPKITGSLASGEWSAADTTAVRRIMPLQNLFWLRGLFNQVEEATNGYFHIPERKEPVRPQ